MIIYKTTNLINGKFYVGKYEGNRDTYIGSGKILKYAIAKHGKENFKRETLEVCDNRKHLNEREIYWIKELNSQYPNGYNITTGGDWGDMLTTHPDRLEIIEKRANNYRKYLLTDEAKRTRSINSRKMWDNPEYVEKQRNAQKIAQNRPETKLNKSINGKKAQSTDEAKKRKSFHSKESWSDPEYKERMLLVVKERWKNAPQIQCVHCGLMSKNKGMINRFHNEKCKRKK